MFLNTIYLPPEAQDYYLRWLAKADAEKQDDLFQIREWYEGRQIETYGGLDDFLGETFKETFKKYPASNVVSHSVDIMSDRLKLTSLGANDAYQKKCQEWWDAERMMSWQDDLHRYLLRDGESIIVVGWSAEDDRPTFRVKEMYDGRSGESKIHYTHDNQVAFVSVRWVHHNQADEPTGITRLNLYFTDRIERYMSGGTSQWRMMTPDEISNIDGVPPIENPEFTIMPNGEPVGIAAVPYFNKMIRSEATEVMTAQAGVNDAILSWYISSRYHGARTILLSGDLKVDPKTLRKIVPKWSPATLVELGKDASVNVIEPANLRELFDGGIVPWLELAARNKRWPLHLFNPVNLPSGELLRQAEAPFVVQCETKHSLINDSHEDLLAVANRMGVYAGSQNIGGILEKNKPGLSPQWRSAVSVADLYDMQVIAQKKAVGDLPQVEVLKLMGYTDKQITDIINAGRQDKMDNLEFMMAEQMLFNGGGGTPANDQQAQDQLPQ